MGGGAVFAIALAGTVAFFSGIADLIHGESGWLQLVCGVIAIGLSVAYVLHEWPHWDKHWTRENFVASSFTFGFSVILWGFFLGHLDVQQIEWVYTVLVGIGILGLSLITGLAMAFLPDWMPAKKYRYVLLQDRYGLDEKYELVIDHPCPWEDRMTPMVRFKTLDGQSFLARATPGAYEFARPGVLADIRIKKRRIVEVTLRQPVKRVSGALKMR